MLSALPLSRAAHLKPQVADWLLSEWPDWYGPAGPGNLAMDIEDFAASDTSLPVGLVLLSESTPVGFGALKATSIESHGHLSPWAAAGFVVPALRGQGLGRFLLAAIVEHAGRLGHPYVYCGTSTAQSLLRRSGWNELEVIVHHGKPLSVFRSEAQPIAQPRPPLAE